MPQCKNDPLRKYSGDEPSPKGLGWCAHAEKEGKIRKGKDNNNWIVTKVSSGSLRWIKLTKNVKTTPRKKSTPKRKSKRGSIKKSDFYGFKPVKKMDYKTWTRDLTKTQLSTFNKLIKNVTKEISALGIRVFVVPLPISKDGQFWMDYPWDYVSKKYEDNNYFANPFIIIVLQLNEDKKLFLPDGGLYIQHNAIRKNYKELFNNLMKNNFKQKYKWNGSQSKSIFLKI